VGTQHIGITLRAYSGELSRSPSYYEARRIDQLKAESSVVFIGSIYTKECGCTSISIHDCYVELSTNRNVRNTQNLIGMTIRDNAKK
jgi:hypothetical protein